MKTFPIKLQFTLKQITNYKLLKKIIKKERYEFVKIIGINSKKEPKFVHGYVRSSSLKKTR